MASESLGWLLAGPLHLRASIRSMFLVASNNPWLSLRTPIAMRDQIPGVTGLMLWRSSLPVLVANLIAWPVAYVYLRHWLNGYAYRIALSPLYFLAAAAVALLIAWVTVYGNTLRLARTSPIHALRYE